MAKQTNLQLYTNTDFAYQFTILNGSETAAVDITGWTLSFMVKEDARDDDDDAIFTIAPAVITGTFNANINTNTQLASITITAATTAALIPADYFWELKRTDDGQFTILANGILSLLKGVHE